MPAPELAAFRPLWTEVARQHAAPLSQAVLGGFRADRLAWAFFSGYQAAGRVLQPDLGPQVTFGLAVTEAGGGHPAAVETRLSEGADGGFVLHGDKRWSTGAEACDVLLVVASAGEGPDGRKQLRAVRVPTDAPGLSFAPMPPTPFAPELGHASVRLDGVRVGADAVLPGDGYLRVVKPFRTLEDVHVHAAVLGHLAGCARRWQWPASALERIVAAVVGLAPLATAPPLDPAVHRVLGGQLAAIADLIAELAPHLDAMPDEVATRWRRDRALFTVAGKARALRLERARQALTA